VGNSRASRANGRSVSLSGLILNSFGPLSGDSLPDLHAHPDSSKLPSVATQCDEQVWRPLANNRGDCTGVDSEP
jgi:hypothetical protein